MAKKPTAQRVTLNLEQNATDSLAHAAEHFLDNKRPTDLKYALLHVFHAVELFLKAALAKAHPVLIYQRPEDAGKTPPKTVDFATLVARLKAVGVQLSDDDRKDLDAIRTERNQIEHYQCSASPAVRHSPS